MTKWLAVVVACLVVVGRFALADDDSARADLIRNIDDKVKSIAGKLSGFDSQRDYSNADDALSYARDVADLVSRLKDVMGSDSRANEIVSNYPGYIDAFRDATRYLKKLKELQFLADGVADRCVHDEADLQTIIRNYVGRPDEADEAFDKLPAKGQDYGRTYSPLLDKLKDADNDLRSNASYARFDISVSSSDNWSDVKSYFNDAASHIASYWKDRYSPIDAACKRIALGDKHPDIERALDDLKKYTGNAKQTVTQLKKDYNAWLADVRKLRKFTDDDRDEIRAAMCKVGFYDEEARVKEVADRWASQISSAYGTVLGQADRLVERATSDKLKKYKGPKQVLEGIQWNRVNLEKLKNYELQGSNNPKIRAKLEYGKKIHDEKEQSLCGSGSGYAEFDISSSYCSNSIRPGSGCRADCVQTSDPCMVIEVKPNSDDAKDEGERQATAYASGIKNWYEHDKAALLKDWPNYRACEHDGKELRVEWRLEIYDFCPSTSEAKSFGDEIKDPPSDLSESDE